MKRILALVYLASACFCQAQIWVNLNTGSTIPPVRIGNTFDPAGDESVMLSDNWRYAFPPSDPSNGYERLSPVTWAQCPTNTKWADPVYHDTLIQSRLDAEAVAASNAAEVARSPVSYPTGIEAPYAVLLDYASTSTYRQVYVYNGSLMTSEDHSSPRPSDSELSARRQTNIALRVELIDALKTIRGSLNTNIDLINSNVTPSDFSAPMRSNLVLIKKGFLDLARDVRNMNNKLIKIAKDEGE